MVNVPAGIRTISPPVAGWRVGKFSTPGPAPAGRAASFLAQPAAMQTSAISAVLTVLDMYLSPQFSREPRASARPALARGSRLNGVLVSRPLMIRRIPQRFLRAGADFRGDRRHPRIQRHQDARPLPQRLHHPAAF